jgi:hypothetical protein
MEKGRKDIRKKYAVRKRNRTAIGNTKKIMGKRYREYKEKR